MINSPGGVGNGNNRDEDIQKILDSLPTNVSILRDRKELLNDKKFFDKALDANPFSYKFASEDVRGDKEIAKMVLERDGRLLEFVHSSLKSDFDVVTTAVKRDGLSLEHASVDLRGNYNVVLEAVKENGCAIQFAVGPNLRKNKEIIVESVVNNRKSIGFLEKTLFSESTFLSELRDSNGDIERVLDLRTSKEFSNLSEPSNILKKKKKSDEWEEMFVKRLKEKPKIFTVTFNSEETVNRKEEFEIQILRKKFSSVRFEDLEIVRKLGEGNYGSTFLCRVKFTEGLFVVKILNYTLTFYEETTINLLMERENLRIPYHSNVVSVLAFRENETILNEEKQQQLPEYFPIPRNRKKAERHHEVKSAMILMKYYRLDLKNYLEYNVPNIIEIRGMMRGIIKGLNHLHENKIVHRDLHPGNIFIDAAYGRIWIGDFGCSLNLIENETGFKVNKTNVMMNSILSSDFFKKGGASNFLAPEIAKFDINSSEQYLDYENCDIFAAGRIGELMLDQCEEYYKESEMYKRIKELVVKMLDDNPNERINFNEACSIINHIE